MITLIDNNTEALFQLVLLSGCYDQVELHKKITITLQVQTEHNVRKFQSPHFVFMTKDMAKMHSFQLPT